MINEEVGILKIRVWACFSMQSVVAKKRKGGDHLPTHEKELELALTRALTSERVKFFEPMSQHTTLRAGGAARFFAEPESSGELKTCLELAKTFHVPYLIIGNGSNLLIRDGGYRGLVISTLALNHIDWDGEKGVAGAGVRLSTLAREALSLELAGLEFAAGIPGTVGGAVYMNAGAYGGEMAQCVKRVWALDKWGTELELSGSDLGFSYRTSNLAKKGLIALAAEFALKKGTGAEIDAQMKELLRKRKEKQPLSLPSAGSFFKRPPGDYAGRLIQEAGLQGAQRGGAEVSTMHANFLVNRGTTKARDFLELAELVVVTVESKFGVKLELEVQVEGDD